MTTKYYLVLIYLDDMITIVAGDAGGEYYILCLSYLGNVIIL